MKAQTLEKIPLDKKIIFCILLEEENKYSLEEEFLRGEAYAKA